MVKQTQGNEEWVLVTGGSHGIGKALALDCLKRKLAVVIVGLPDQHLAEIETELGRGASARFEIMGLDLTRAGAFDEILAFLQQKGITIKYLINNAGFGRGGLIEHTAWQEYLTMMQLNNQVMVGLTLALLPQLKAKRGGILNMSSMEATLPLPYKTVYTGTKAFVYNYSLALRQEMKYYDVGVSVLCPGPVITNADGLVRVKAMGWKAKVLVTLPEDMAPGAISAFLKNRDVIRPGALVKVILAITHWIPRGWKLPLMEKLFSKYRVEEATPVGPKAPELVEEKQ